MDNLQTSPLSPSYTNTPRGSIRAACSRLIIKALPDVYKRQALGVVVGNLLPARVVSALSVALYGMFLAIIIPPARKNKVVAALVLLSFALSFACGRLPLVSSLSSGTRTILLTVALSAGAALLFPVKDAEKEGNAP